MMYNTSATFYIYTSDFMYKVSYGKISVPLKIYKNKKVQTKCRTSQTTSLNVLQVIVNFCRSKVTLWLRHVNQKISYIPSTIVVSLTILVTGMVIWSLLYYFYHINWFSNELFVIYLNISAVVVVFLAIVTGIVMSSLQYTKIISALVVVFLAKVTGIVMSALQYI